MQTGKHHLGANHLKPTPKKHFSTNHTTNSTGHTKYAHCITNIWDRVNL